MKLEIIANPYAAGVINIGGSKNSAVAIIPAVLLCDEEVILEKVPNNEDCHTLIEIIKTIGATVVRTETGYKINSPPSLKTNITTPLVKKLRGSYYLFGSLLGRKGRIKTFLPGGCNLGKRPIDYHLDGFKKMNIDYIIDDTLIELSTERITGTTIDLPFPSVGATINLMLAAVKAAKTTIINNCALEPEVIDVANFLVSMGAKISGIGTNSLTITGVKFLHKTSYTIMPDRIEAGTYLILGALSEGSGITVNDVSVEHLTAVIEHLSSIGADIITNENSITIKKGRKLATFALAVDTYPAFPTDLQQLLTTLMTQIDGSSSVTETIFQDRFSQVSELIKMGAQIEVIDRTVKVDGITPLRGSNVFAQDLRGGAALVLAGIIASGKTTINNIDVFLRGYEDPIDKLSQLGVKCRLI